MLFLRRMFAGARPEPVEWANMTNPFLRHPRVLSLVILAPFLRHPREGEDLLTFLQRMFACANMTNDYPPEDSRLRGNDEDDV